MNTPIPRSRPVPADGAARIKLRIFIPLILAVAVLLASFIFFFALRQDQNQRSEQEIRRTANDLQKLLRSKQQDDTDLMVTTIQAILNDERMAHAFRARDHEALPPNRWTQLEGLVAAR